MIEDSVCFDIGPQGFACELRPDHDGPHKALVKSHEFDTVEWDGDGE